MDISPLQEARKQFKPRLPRVLAENGPNVGIIEGAATASVADQEKIQELFPNTYGLPEITFEGKGADGMPINIGVILSGGQAPGGHNVIAGLYDGVKAISPDSKLYGFKGGPKGLWTNDYVLFDDGTINDYRNTGGFDIIGSGRDKLESEEIKKNDTVTISFEKFEKTIANCKALGIKGLVVIGGDDSNTNACVLAEYCKANATGITVVGCPKTIDGDLKNEQIETSFGFDTATKVYAELIGNIQRDANSAKKYWHFIKLMGRSASHIALECALKTHANVTLISEEIEAQDKTMKQIVRELAEIVKVRSKAGKNFGVVLIPEGLLEFIPEVKKLIRELNDLVATDYYKKDLDNNDDRAQYINSHLTPESSQVLSSLPGDIQRQLMLSRDSHGNVPVSQIETDKLLIDLVGDLLGEWKSDDQYAGKFSALSHFFGYEGRCAAPSNFDANYCYALGYTASALSAAGKTGYISSVRNLKAAPEDWTAGGVPLTMMMNIERRELKDKPVIRKALVELDGKPFKALVAGRDAWAVGDEYIYPGPIQYFGPSEVCDQPTDTLKLERA